MDSFFFFKNFAYFIPTLNNFFSFLIILFLTIVFDQYGHLIIKKKTPINFFIGWGVFYLIIFFLNFLLKFDLDKIIILFLIIGFLFFLINYKKNIFTTFFTENKIFLTFSFLYVLLLMSSKTKEWDSFAFWGLNINYLIENKIFPNSNDQILKVHGNNPQMFGTSYIVYVPHIFLKIFPENVSAIFNFIILFKLFLFFKHFIKKNENYLILIPLFFLNPFIINSKSFSLYNDFTTSILLTAVYLLIYNQYLLKVKKLEISSNQFWIAIFFTSSLVLQVKSTGYVHIVISLFCLTLLLIFLKLRYEYFRLAILFLLISLLFFLIKFSFDGQPGSNFLRYYPRVDLLNEIILNSFYSLFNNKFYFIFYFIFLIILFINFLKKKEVLNSIYIFFYTLSWFLFIVISYLVFFVKNEAINANSFNRYLSQVNIIVLIYIILFFLNFLSKKYFKKLTINFNKIKNIFITLIFVLPIFLADKLRRDLQYPLIDIANIDSEINLINYQNIFVITDDTAYISQVMKFYANISNIKLSEKPSEDITIDNYDLILYINRNKSCFINKKYEPKKKYRCNNSLL
jgi:hypothetical protein